MKNNLLYICQGAKLRESIQFIACCLHVKRIIPIIRHYLFSFDPFVHFSHMVTESHFILEIFATYFTANCTCLLLVNLQIIIL